MRPSSAEPAELRRFGEDDLTGIGGVLSSSGTAEDGLARYRWACPEGPVGDAGLVEALRTWARAATELAEWVLAVADAFRVADLVAGTARPHTLDEAVVVLRAHRATFDTAHEMEGAEGGRRAAGDGFVSLADLRAMAFGKDQPEALADAARILLIMARHDEDVRPVFTRPSAWDRFGGLTHLALDLAGLLPLVGNVADVANGVIFALERKWVDASISAAGALPGGQASTASRVGRFSAAAGLGPGLRAAAGKASRATKGAGRVGEGYQVAEGTRDGDWTKVLGAGVPLAGAIRHPAKRVMGMAGATRLATEVGTQAERRARDETAERAERRRRRAEATMRTDAGDAVPSPHASGPQR